MWSTETAKIADIEARQSNILYENKESGSGCINELLALAPEKRITCDPLIS